VVWTLKGKWDKSVLMHDVNATPSGDKEKDKENATVH
jgi:hypothetical protein